MDHCRPPGNMDHTYYGGSWWWKSHLGYQGRIIVLFLGIHWKKGDQKHIWDGQPPIIWNLFLIGWIPAKLHLFWFRKTRSCGPKGLEHTFFKACLFWISAFWNMDCGFLLKMCWQLSQIWTDEYSKKHVARIPLILTVTRKVWVIWNTSLSPEIQWIAVNWACRHVRYKNFTPRKSL